LRFNNNAPTPIQQRNRRPTRKRAPNDAALKTEFPFYYTAPTRFLEDASNKKTRNFAKDSENRRPSLRSPSGVSRLKFQTFFSVFKSRRFNVLSEPRRRTAPPFSFIERLKINQRRRFQRI